MAKLAKSGRARWPVCTKNRILKKKCLIVVNSPELFSCAAWGRLWQRFCFLFKRIQSIVWRWSCQIWQLINCFLLLPDIPMQAFGQRGEPVRNLILGTNRWHRINRSRHMKTIAMLKFLSFSSIERYPCSVTAVWWHGNFQFYSSWYNNWSKGQWVRADGGDHDSGHRGVNHGGPGGHSVGRAARGCRDDEAIPLDRCD